jgi:hypothetical protein
MFKLNRIYNKNLKEPFQFTLRDILVRSIESRLSPVAGSTNRYVTLKGETIEIKINIFQEMIEYHEPTIDRVK